MRGPRPLALLLLLPLLLPARADDGARAPLPIGQTSEAKTPAEAPAVFVHEVDGAGALMVLVRAKDGADLAIYVTDKDGQTLPDGEVDRGLDGNNGAEQLVVVLPAAGTYLVQVVAPQSGGAEVPFLIGGAWLPAPALAREPDPDGAPSSARTLEVGGAAEDELGPAKGDRWDWFVVAPTKAGTLVIRTVASEDLRLELFQENRFLAPFRRADDDLGGVPGHESLELPVQAGKRYYLRVLAVDLSAEKLAYKVTAELR